MNCIDAIEGTVKTILDGLHRLSVEERLDDSEYIRNVKAVIEAAETFVRINRQVSVEPGVLKDTLYAYAKELWIVHQDDGEPIEEETHLETDDGDNSSDSGYRHYYFDYIYHHGVYPR